MPSSQQADGLTVFWWEVLGEFARWLRDGTPHFRGEKPLLCLLVLAVHVFVVAITAGLILLFAGALDVLLASRALVFGLFRVGADASYVMVGLFVLYSVLAPSPRRGSVQRDADDRA